jgi:hypothetical protein
MPRNITLVLVTAWNIRDRGLGAEAPLARLKSLAHGADLSAQLIRTPRGRFCCAIFLDGRCLAAEPTWREAEESAKMNIAGGIFEVPFPGPAWSMGRDVEDPRRRSLGIPRWVVGEHIVPKGCPGSRRRVFLEGVPQRFLRREGICYAVSRMAEWRESGCPWDYGQYR